jgi:hypothetical protein
MFGAGFVSTTSGTLYGSALEVARPAESAAVSHAADAARNVKHANASRR